MLLAIHFARSGLLGKLPNPLPVAEVPSAAARFANAFSGPRRLSYVWSRAGLVRKTKRKEPGLEVSFPLNLAFCSGSLTANSRPHRRALAYQEKNLPHPSPSAFARRLFFGLNALTWIGIFMPFGKQGLNQSHWDRPWYSFPPN